MPKTSPGNFFEDFRIGQIIRHATPRTVTVGEAIENIPAKFFREADVWVKTKTPVLVLRTDNEIPKE